MYNANIQQLVLDNLDFRHVLYTTPLSQVVAMCLQSNEDIGEEAHHGHDQLFVVMQGQAEAIVADQHSTMTIGSILVVPAGSMHNIINGPSTELKLLTIYTPPTHADGTIHHTKAEAIKEEQEEGQAGGEAAAGHYDNEEVVEVVGY